MKKTRVQKSHATVPLRTGLGWADLEQLSCEAPDETLAEAGLWAGDQLLQGPLRAVLHEDQHLFPSSDTRVNNDKQIPMSGVSQRQSGAYTKKVK